MKKATNAVQLSPLETARVKAQMMLDLDNKKAELEAQINAIKEELKAFVKESGERDLGVYTVTESEAKPVLNFGSLTANAKSRVLEQLSQELPDYLKSKTELDIERLYYAMPSTPAVVNALKVRNLEFDLVATLAFRKVK